MAMRTTPPFLDEAARRAEIEARRAAYQQGLSNAERLRVSCFSFAAALAIVGALVLAR